MIIRTYQCTDCGIVFEVTLEHANDPDPDCPSCTRVLDWVPRSFNIATVKSKAINVAQEILEQDYGLTNWNDSGKEGDIAAQMPVETREMREQKAQVMQEAAQLKDAQGNNPALQQAVKAFWAGGGGSAMPRAVANNMLASAKVGQAAPKHLGGGVNPVAMLAEDGRKGLLPTGFRIIARAKMDGSG